MSKKKAGGQNGLSVNFYRKTNNKVGLVFKKNKMLYRISTATLADRLVREFNACVGLSRPKLIQIQSPRNRKWALELAAVGLDQGSLIVWELLNTGHALTRFKWEGELWELNNLFNDQFNKHEDQYNRVVCFTA